jgi:uncharacterized protein (DUF1499 family)
LSKYRPLVYHEFRRRDIFLPYQANGWEKMLKNLLFLICLILLAGIVLSIIFGQDKPLNLGHKEDLLTPCPDTSNCVSSQSRDQDHRVEPLAVPEGLEDPIKRLKELIRGMPRTKVVMEEEGYLWVRFSSKTLRFKDDLEFLLDPTAKEVHVRSASRLGRYDFGVNRKRVEAIREMFFMEKP